jgi:hypothetical protein
MLRRIIAADCQGTKVAAISFERETSFNLGLLRIAAATREPLPKPGEYWSGVNARTAFDSFSDEAHDLADAPVVAAQWRHPRRLPSQRDGDTQLLDGRHAEGTPGLSVAVNYCTTLSRIV